MDRKVGKPKEIICKFIAVAPPLANESALLQAVQCRL